MSERLPPPESLLSKLGSRVGDITTPRSRVRQAVEASLDNNLNQDNSRSKITDHLLLFFLNPPSTLKFGEQTTPPLSYYWMHVKDKLFQIAGSPNKQKAERLSLDIIIAVLQKQEWVKRIEETPSNSTSDTQYKIDLLIFLSDDMSRKLGGIETIGIQAKTRNSLQKFLNEHSELAYQIPIIFLFTKKQTQRQVLEQIVAWLNLLAQPKTKAKNLHKVAASLGFNQEDFVWPSRRSYIEVLVSFFQNQFWLHLADSPQKPKKSLGKGKRSRHNSRNHR